jgi:hypothetical protein
VIKKGFPPKRTKRKNDRTKMKEGALIDVADRIEPGQYVEDLSAGSEGRFAERVRSRGLEVVRRRGQGKSRGTVYVVTSEWLAKNPDV